MFEDQSPEPIRAKRKEINLGEAVLDAYMLPNGEKRLGIAGASVALGHHKSWFGRLPVSGKKLLKALDGMGFTGCKIEVSVAARDKSISGSSIANTISADDFIKLTSAEAILNRNRQAIILLAAFASHGLEQTLEDAFADRSLEAILNKIVHFSKWTYEEFEIALRENREDVRALYQWGYWLFTGGQELDLNPLFDDNSDED